MGVLDDAIREHLELKRQHGVPEEELQRQEEEALGPARRDVAQQPEEAEPAAGPDGDRRGGAAEPRPTRKTALFDMEDGRTAATPAARPRRAALPEADAALPEEAAAPGEPPIAEPPVEEPRPEEPRAGAARPRAAGRGARPRGGAAGRTSRPRRPLSPPGRASAASSLRAARAPPAATRIDDRRRARGDEPELERGRGSPRVRAEGDELDVLEDTPDFLQETPEHDRLWFEQKPPRDFDFD